MERLKRAALITRLIERLRDEKNWCGETHVQKSTFFLQELMKVPLGYDFILYKHGPFSFDLRDELTGFRADELIRLELQHPPYGPRLALTDRSEYIQGLSSRTVAKYDDRIDFVAKAIGDRGVADLERVATALFLVRRMDVRGSVEERSRRLTELKPHISPEKAKSAIEEVDRIITRATSACVNANS